MDASRFAECWERGSDPSRPWMFLVSSPSGIGDLPQKLGRADYSYGFVVKSLAPVLERLGHWRQVIAPESCLVHAAAQAIEEGFRPVHLAVMPVHPAYLTPAVPTILFPFWEFPRIPDRDFGWETRQNWARVARRASLIVTACEMTAKSFRQAGVGCPVEVVPVPVADETFHVPPWSPDFTWRITCRHVSWGGPPVDPGAPAAAMADPIRIARPRARRLESGREGPIQTVRQALAPPAVPSEWVSRIPKRATLQALRRRGRRGRAAAPGTRHAARAVGVGLHESLQRRDLRKNPHDLLTAFLLAFKDRRRCDAGAEAGHDARDRVPPRRSTFVSMYQGYGIEHRCRVVVIADYLSDDELLGLFRATTFYVNTSRAEGACLPLQQALACGRPAIAPAHTAMADYMDDRVGFVVASQPEPTHWPHDPQKRIKTSWQRLDWSSLRDQYLRSRAGGLAPRRNTRRCAAAARRQ